MTTPTREEVEEKLKRWDIIRKDNPEEEFKCWYEAIQEAWQAYLAQAQELEAKQKVLDMFRESAKALNRRVQELDAENRALREANTTLNEQYERLLHP